MTFGLGTWCKAASVATQSNWFKLSVLESLVFISSKLCLGCFVAPRSLGGIWSQILVSAYHADITFLDVICLYCLVAIDIFCSVEYSQSQATLGMNILVFLCLQTWFLRGFATTSFGPLMQWVFLHRVILRAHFCVRKCVYISQRIQTSKIFLNNDKLSIIEGNSFQCQ